MRFSHTALYCAVKHGSCRIIRALMNSENHDETRLMNPDPDQWQTLQENACRSGNVDCFKLVHAIIGENVIFNTLLYATACTSGNLELLAELDRLGCPADTMSYFWTIHHRHWHVLDYLHDVKKVPWNRALISPMRYIMNPSQYELDASGLAFFWKLGTDIGPECWRGFIEQNAYALFEWCLHRFRPAMTPQHKEDLVATAIRANRIRLLDLMRRNRFPIEQQQSIELATHPKMKCYLAMHCSSR